MQNDLTVYIDASVVFHLSSGAADRLFGANWRSHAAKWWETQRPHFELYTSALALEEAGRGDPEEAARQLEALDGIPRLEITDEVIALANELIRREEIPPDERNAHHTHRGRGRAQDPVSDDLANSAYCLPGDRATLPACL